MKICKLKISNFRSIENAEIDCVGYNSFVGPNSSGKSVVLDALNVFFEDRKKYNEGDFFNKNTASPAEIEVTFDDLSEACKEEFSHDVREDQLTICARLTADENGNISYSVHTKRLVFEEFSPIFEKGINANRVEELYNEYREKYSEIPEAKTKQARIDAVQEYEESSIDAAQKTLRESSDKFQGAVKLKPLDAFIEWVYVPAVKDASSEAEEGRASHMGTLIKRYVKNKMDCEDELMSIKQVAVEAYREMLEQQNTHLESLQNNVASRLKDSFLSDVDVEIKWSDRATNVNIGDPIAQAFLTNKGFVGEVESFGHGLQRAFILALLQEYDLGGSENPVSLILGIEEPELYQHPPQIRHLSWVLQNIANTEGNQIFLTTHSPYFVDLSSIPGLKRFQNDGGGTKIVSAQLSDLSSLMTSDNGTDPEPEHKFKTQIAVNFMERLRELFFAEKVILVEGVSDESLISTYMKLFDLEETFRKSGAMLVTTGGKESIPLFVALARSFEIPYYVIFDMDLDKQGDALAMSIKSNNAIFRICERDDIDETQSEDISDSNITAWRYNLEEMCKENLGEEKYAEIDQASKQAIGYDNDKARKRMMYGIAFANELKERNEKLESLEIAIKNFC